MERKYEEATFTNLSSISISIRKNIAFAYNGFQVFQGIIVEHLALLLLKANMN